MKAAIYTRVSTPDQAVNGESLDMQKERLIEYVKNHGWELYKAYEDGGFSGKNVNRPAFQKMMKDVEFKKFDILVVYKIDRLSRSVLDFHTTMKFLEKQGISFVSVTQQFDTTNSMGRLMLNILVDFANFEREINVDRSIDSYLQRLHKGIPSGAIPYGYRREEDGIAIVESEAIFVRELFSLALQGLSTNEISKKTGLTPYHVRSIITNPFYTGYLARRRDRFDKRIKENDWEWYQGQHKPIISVELFQQVAQKRQSKARVANTKYKAFFSHLIYCPKCKHNLSFHTRTKKTKIVFYYRCDPIKIDEKSCGQYLREEPLEVILSRQIDKVFKLQKPENNEKDDDSIIMIDRKIKRLVRLAEEEDVTVEEFKQRIEELKKQKALLLAHQITKLDYSKISEKLKTIISIYPYMTREEKSRLWHLLIIRIEACKSLVSVYWRGGGKYTFKHDRLAKNLKVLNTKGRLCGGGGGIRTLDTPGMSRML